MEEIDVRHIHVLEFPKLLLWTDRDLEYFLEEMSSEECRMNNDIYDVFIKEVEAGKDYQPEEAFNLAYYECVRISLAKYPESRDIIDVLELDIQHNQSHVNYGFTDLIMNMVWAMLHSTNTATRFADKLHSYLVNKKKLKFWFRSFFTPNDIVYDIFPYSDKEEPRYNVIFTPCPKDIEYKSSNGEWCKLTIGYKEHLIEELLLLWPKERRDYVRKCIMDEKTGQLNNFADFVKSNPVCEDEVVTVEMLEEEISNLKAEINQLTAEKATLESSLSSEKEKTVREKNERNSRIEQLQKERNKWWKKYGERQNNEPEKAFNAQTEMPCFTSRQMGILLTAVGRITEREKPPGKTTLGDIIEKIAGYKSTTASSNMRGEMPPKDTEAVATAIESKFPNLAAEVRKI